LHHAHTLAEYLVEQFIDDQQLDGVEVFLQRAQAALVALP
jgi:hypothetical protein